MKLFHAAETLQKPRPSVVEGMRQFIIGNATTELEDPWLQRILPERDLSSLEFFCRLPVAGFEGLTFLLGEVGHKFKHQGKKVGRL